MKISSFLKVTKLVKKRPIRLELDCRLLPISPVL